MVHVHDPGLRFTQSPCLTFRHSSFITLLGTLSLTMDVRGCRWCIIEDMVRAHVEKRVYVVNKGKVSQALVSGAG